MTDDDDRKAALFSARVMDEVERIKPLLAGLDPTMQGAVVANLTAIWLHREIKDLRREMLDANIKLVWKLVSAYDEAAK
jgi:hypothetical protein